MFSGLSNLGALIKQAQQIGGKLDGLQQELKKHRATGAAGGGLVEVEVNGASEVLAVRIDSSLLVQQDRELIEDLVRGATNDALTKARGLYVEAMKSLTGGGDLPGFQDMLAKFTGGSG